jgi:hypothetical protein
VRAELYRPEAPDEVVAVAVWNGRSVDLDVRDPSPAEVERIFRPTPVVVDDPSQRRPGARGAVVLEPGDLAWFRAALLARAPVLGLAVRFVVTAGEGGWDPAGDYRTFSQQIDRLTRPTGRSAN